MLIVILLTATVSLCRASDELTVEYFLNGTRSVVHGYQTDNNTYVFNETGVPEITVTTLDWQPYIGRDLCRQGWVQQVTVALLASRGFRVVCSFYPWARTIYMAETGRADILYPEYFIEKTAPSDIIPGTRRRDHLALSRPIPGGPIAFMKRRDEPDGFGGDLLNLKAEKIGVVRGYQNTPEFDHLMDQGYFQIDEAIDDVMNVRKLINRRVNLIVGDPSAIRYSIQNDRRLNDAQRDQFTIGIEVVKPILQYNHLYYAVSTKRPEWQKTLAELDQAIDEFSRSGELERLIQETNQICGFHMETLRN